MSRRGTTSTCAAILGAAVLGVAGVAGAQTAPSGDSRVTSPYWGRDLDRADGRAVETTAAIAVAAAVPQAAAEAAQARMTSRLLDRDINRAVRERVADFENSEAFVLAQEDFRLAYEAYEAARYDAVRPLVESDGYVGAMVLAGQVDQQIDATRDSVGPGEEPDLARLAAMAKLKLEYRSPLRQAEREAVAASAEVRAARARLMESAREIVRLRAEFARDMRGDAELVELRRAKDEARTQRVVTSTYLNRLVDTRNGVFEFLDRDRDDSRRYSPYVGYPWGYYGGSYVYHGGVRVR